MHVRRRTLPLAGGLVAAAAVAVGLGVASADPPGPAAATTPIKHVVVIFGENISFDHYFGTYPNATNPAGEPRFTASAGTPSTNGLNEALLTHNPNSANPKRLDRSQAVTCSQNHGYGAEQKAFDGGTMDRFVEETAGGSCTDKSIVMDYYDGNTVTGLWNLAQHFSLNDNSYSTNFGPSTVGAINLISGQTHGATPPAGVSGVENGTVIGDPDPAAALDDCGKGGVSMSGKNVGDLLNAHNVTWGWFEGGFRPTATTNGKAVCGSQHANVAGGTSTDYVPHHEPFEYYASTANPHHLPPSSPQKIGRTDQANHQYGLSDFDTALRQGNLPQVSFLKAAAFEDAHPGNSDPLDEQRFVARTLNALEQSPEWSSTAVVLAYDDSDGWFDHQMSPILSPSAAPSDALNGPGRCGTVKDPAAYPDRCGYGPRQPLLVVSPYARQDYVDHSLTDQSSILRFIEDNWKLGRIGDQSMDAEAGTLNSMFDFSSKKGRASKVYLDPDTGEVVSKPAKPAKH
jgi:phospholipase C